MILLIVFCFLCFVEVLAQGEVSHEAQHLIIKIRRQVRLLNRKWTELNQGCHEWQSRIGQAAEVKQNTFFICYLLPSVVHFYLYILTSYERKIDFLMQTFLFSDYEPFTKWFGKDGGTLSPCRASQIQVDCCRRCVKR